MRWGAWAPGMRTAPMTRSLSATTVCDVLLGGVEGGELAAEDVVEVGEAVGIDVEDGDGRAEAHGHLGRVGADDAAAEYGDLAARHAGDAAQEHAAAAEGLLEVLGPLLHREPAGYLAHGLEAGQGPVGQADRLVGDALDLARQEGVGLLPVGGEVEVGEEDLPLAEEVVLLGLGLLHFDDHVAGGEDLLSVRFDLGAGLGVFGILEAGVGPRPRLDESPGARGPRRISRSAESCPPCTRAALSP